MGKRFKVKNKEKLFVSFLKIIVLLVAIGIAIYFIFGPRGNKKIESVAEEKTDIAEQNVEEVNEEKEEVGETTTQTSQNKNKKIDFLANVDTPLYKKDEKNIKIPVLIYHCFRTPIPEEQDIYKLFSSEENFEENVTTMLDDGYTFITFEELYKYDKGEIGLPEKVAIISIDDGQVGCYTDAFPVVKKYNVPVTIFIVNTLVGTEDYFSWEEAKEMYDTGLVKIHCHGYKHSAYDKESKETVISDYTKSHQEIEEHMGEKIQKMMAYPAGKSNANTVKWLKEIGFEIQVQTRYGTVENTKTLDLTNIGRIRAERATGKQLLNTINAAKI